MCIHMELFPSHSIKWKMGQNSILYLHERRNAYTPTHMLEEDYHIPGETQKQQQ